jgi:hypothetical protein
VRNLQLRGGKMVLSQMTAVLDAEIAMLKQARSLFADGTEAKCRPD